MNPTTLPPAPIDLPQELAGERWQETAAVVAQNLTPDIERERELVEVTNGH